LEDIFSLLLQKNFVNTLILFSRLWSHVKVAADSAVLLQKIAQIFRMIS